ncbi:MAG: hypothetical protein KF688_01335 [Pirellulales bacterium]|nr:hypothetical protein [Pirellulales bacterium]MBX3434156.1 hypothetical protein [Pirellulales bacterium]
MDRTFAHAPTVHRAALLAAAILLATGTGCIGSIIATGVYLFQGGNVVPAECSDLENQRVVVVCRPPSSQEYRHAGAARAVGERVANLLEQNVKKIDVVSQREVDNWIDEQDWENFKDLGRSVKATRVVYIELDDFELYKGKTLYQGNADVTVSVYDMNERGKLMWDRQLGQVLFPRNSGIPAADKPVHAFQRQFVEVISTKIAEHFYKHNPNSEFALDAVANQ